MFKNKKIVALALLAVMLIVPFASAFAAVTNDWIRVFQDAVNAVPNLAAESNAVLAAAMLYAGAPTDANKADYNDKLKDYQDAVKGYNAKLSAAETAKGVAAAHDFDEYVNLNAGPAPNYEASIGGGPADFANAGLAKAAFNAAKTDLATARENKKTADGKIDEAKLRVKLGDLLKEIKDKQAAEADAIAKAKVALDIWVAAYNAAGLTDAEKAALKPYMEGAFKDYAKVAGVQKAEEYLVLQANPAKAVLAAVDLKATDVTELQAKDAKGKTWKVIAPKSAPDALNGAVKVEVRKTEKGFKLALLDKDNKEVASKGLVYVYREVAKGTKVKDVKVGGKTASFSFDPKTNMIDFALEIAK